MATTIREHLKKTHTAAAEFHVNAAKSHEALAKCFEKMENLESADDVAAAHRALSEQHLSLGEFHAACAADCAKSVEVSKAAGMTGDADRFADMIPDQIRGIGAADAPSQAFVRTAIPRAGAPPIKQEQQVAGGFEKFVTIEDD